MKKAINYVMFLCMLSITDLIVYSGIANNIRMDAFTVSIITVPIILETMFVMGVMIPDIQAMQKKGKTKKANRQKKVDSEFKVLEKESA